MIDSLRYLDLATADRRGPWLATLAYRLGGDQNFFCTSQRASRHVQALRSRSRVAGSIYDSTVADAAVVDGVQFEGSARIVTDAQLFAYLAKASSVNPSLDIEDKMRRVRESPDTVVLDIAVRRLYVPDQEVWRQEGADARLEVDVETVFDCLKSSRAT